MKKMTLLNIIGSIAALTILSPGCLHSPVAPQESPDFMVDFQEIWLSYQFDYPLFVYKGIDWLDVGDEYYHLVNECNTREEFYLVLEDLLGMLKDRVIWLETYDGGGSTPPENYVYPWQNEYTQNVDYEVLMNNYLQQYSFQPCSLGMGFCDPELLPYCKIDIFPGYEMEAGTYLTLDTFIALCNELNTPAIILDLRVQGQRNCMADSIAGRFTDTVYSSVTVRSRGGPDYWNYYDIPQTVKTVGPEQYTGTVIVLMGEQNRGGTEILCAELGYNQNVVLVGGQTMGSVSSYHSCTTSSDICCTVPYKTIMMHDGTWLEGVGVPADIYVETTPGDFALGIDPVLEYAIELLEQYR